jgi:pilus assembly protein CpaF
MFGKKPVESSAPIETPGSAGGQAVSHGAPPTGGTVKAQSLSSNTVGGVSKPQAQDVAGIMSYRNTSLETDDYREAKNQLISEMLDQVDFQALERFPLEQRRARISDAADRILPSINIPLNQQQIAAMKQQATDEIVGFGPIEPLLNDPDVNDIMINTAKRIYIERAGKLYVTDIEFSSEKHLLGIIQRIVSRVGRRVDESTPMVDARMPDGSRFNAIIPPLALDGALVSIRKFKKHKMPLNDYVALDSMSPAMAKFLSICGAVRLNIIVSGGTGSGKTTLLNALSGNIDVGERVITIEDAAELQMHQPHVLRLETRPASLEGRGEINQRALVKNALRMRPDRIILGEIRGDEVIDVLAAMNTGHDGSMATIHANSPRDCLARIENLVAMSAVAVGINSLRYQISSAVNMIVQIQRMRDGRRRVTRIEEVVGFESGSGTILTQTLFSYRFRGIRQDGVLDGEFVAHGIRPKMLERAEYFGLAEDALACIGNLGGNPGSPA